jgi:Cu-Zn family superoxide dismutase
MKTNKSFYKTLGFMALAIALFTTNLKAQDMPKMDMKMNLKAVCVLYPTQGNNVTGTITFTATEKGVRVVADIHGLTQGKHGFHIHECGDCTAANGSSAGGHFNPMGKSHGSSTDMMRHMGDMGNIVADANGNAQLDYFDNIISLTGEYSIIGRAIIVHKDEDDLKTQPTGNAGARVACGVIGISK